MRLGKEELRVLNGALTMYLETLQEATGESQIVLSRAEEQRIIKLREKVREMYRGRYLSK